MTRRVLLLLVIFALIPFLSHSTPYMCGDTGAIYSDQSLCSAACSTPCQALIPSTQGTIGSCDSNKYEGFVYNPDTQCTYALTKYAGFWTDFNRKDNNPSLAIVSGSTVNGILRGMLSFYGVSQAWIGCYDPDKSTAYNTNDPSRFVWWNSDALQYSNWDNKEPNNTVFSEDLGVVRQLGEHWCVMHNNGYWYDVGYHYSTTPYYPALVQWNGKLDCVNGVSSDEEDVTQVSQDLTQEYCDGESPCYLCTDSNTGEIRECINNQLCPIGMQECLATYSNASCPAGSTLNPDTDKCEAEGSLTCPSGGSYDSSIGKCVANATETASSGESKVSGLGIEINNGNIRYCFRSLAFFDDIHCGHWIPLNGFGYSGVGWDLTYYTCPVSTGCNSAYFHEIQINNSRIRFCLYDGGVKCAPWVSFASSGTSGIYIYSSSSGIHVCSINGCPTNGNPRGIQISNHKIRYFDSDNSGKIIYGPWIPLTASYSCPSGYTLSGTKCYADPDTNCPSGTSYNPSTNLCESAPLCPAGSYDTNENKCFEGYNTCPMGNYQCVTNPSDGKNYCSSYSCYNISSGEGITIEDDNITKNDKQADGTVDENGCEGNIYIFNGGSWGCRPPGLQTGGSNCCKKSKDWFGLGSCKAEEKKLAKLRANGFCHYVGSKCIEKFLGTCLQKKKVYCCFHSLLARVVQEQARMSQALPYNGWGDADSPICWGFTPEQFQKIDWSKIDLSEYYSYITQTIIPSATQKAQELQQTVNQKFTQELSGQ